MAVIIDPETRALLIREGWTPPEEKVIVSPPPRPPRKRPPTRDLYPDPGEVYSNERIRANQAAKADAALGPKQMPDEKWDTIITALEEIATSPEETPARRRKASEALERASRGSGPLASRLAILGTFGSATHGNHGGGAAVRSDIEYDGGPSNLFFSDRQKEMER